MASQSVSSLPLRTPLHAAHVAAGARMGPFAGWEMPIQYAGVLSEARAVRGGAGVFDVSHMGRLRLEGGAVAGFLQRVLTADVLALRPGRARYCFLLNEQGGILDDAIISHVVEGRYLLVCNAANRALVVDWLRTWSGGFPSVALRDETEETVMLAVQGPSAVATIDALAGFLPFDQLPFTLRPFGVAEAGGRQVAVVSRTGYTGEDGVELVIPAATGVRLWPLLVERGVTPCGLGARDVLRLEAGLALHGSDIDSATSPLEAGLERFVSASNTEFIGRDALAARGVQEQGRKLVGFRLRERGIPRHGQHLLGPEGAHIGVVTSGGYSPTLDADIGMGYVPRELAKPGQGIVVDIRGRQAPAEVVPLPFYKRRR